MTGLTQTGVGTIELINRIKNGATIIDDHTGEEIQLQGYAVLSKGDVCPMIKGTYFSLNPLYISERNEIHLSRMSVGGVVNATKEMDKAVEEYNQTVLPSRRIIDYKMF